MPAGFVRARSPADEPSREEAAEEVGGTDGRESMGPLLDRTLPIGCCPDVGQGGQHRWDMLETTPEELKPHQCETLLLSRLLWVAPWLLLGEISVSPSGLLLRNDDKHMRTKRWDEQTWCHVQVL